MSKESSPNNSFQDESRVKEPLTPNVKLTSPRLNTIPNTNILLNEQSNGSSKFIFDDNSTPLQRSTNSINQTVSTAPPFLRNSNDAQLTNIPADLVDINLAIGALDLDFGAAARSKDKEPKEKTDENVPSETVEESAQPIDSGAVNPGPQLGNGFHHQQPFHPFFPVNGFGHPLPANFTPGEPLDASQLPPHQAWAAKPGQNPFGNVNGDPSNPENITHAAPIPHPGMVPFRPFDFRPDGLATPPPPHLTSHSPGLIPDVNFNNFNEGAVLENGRIEYHPGNSQVFQNGMDPMNFGNRQGLQNPQLWPPLNGRPQDFNDAFGGIPPPNGLRQNNNNDRGFQYFPNNGNNLHHHHHHNNHNHHGNNYGNRRYRSYRKHGEDAARFANAKLDDFIGQIYSLCKDQHGCRFLQKQLDLDEKSATAIFDEIHPHVIELMMDSFGNYLIQKLLEKVNDEQRSVLVKNASPELVAISLDPHGTRALQKLVESISSPEQAQIVIAALSGHVVTLSRDLNGNHVIQKCLEVFTHDDCQFIFDAAIGDTLKIATHRHGCCVLQRCLDHGSPEQRQSLSAVVSKIADTLSYDAFGNYVVQYVLANDDKESVIEIVDAVREDVINLSLHKFGSNVIEKCLRTTKHASKLIDALLDKEDHLARLLNDSFGNYVLQTCTEVADEQQLAKLSALLKPLLPQIKNTPHGRRISARLNTE